MKELAPLSSALLPRICFDTILKLEVDLNSMITYKEGKNLMIQHFLESSFNSDFFSD